MHNVYQFDASTRIILKENYNYMRRKINGNIIKHCLISPYLVSTNVAMMSRPVVHKTLYVES